MPLHLLIKCITFICNIYIFKFKMFKTFFLRLIDTHQLSWWIFHIWNAIAPLSVTPEWHHVTCQLKCQKTLLISVGFPAIRDSDPSNKWPKTYHFNIELESKYFFHMLFQIQFVSCRTRVSLAKKVNLERHLKKQKNKFPSLLWTRN